MFGKLVRLGALITALALGLCGCTRGGQDAAEDAAVALPEPPIAETDQILGDSSQDALYEVNFYHAAGDSGDLSAVTRQISVGRGENLIENTLRELIGTDLGAGALRSGSQEVALQSWELSCGTLTVNLSTDALVRQSDQEYLLNCAAIANTLLGLDGVQAVNLLIGGRSDGIAALPLGAFCAPVENPTAQYAQLMADAERLGGESAAAISRDALIYYPCDDGDYLLAEARTLSFSSDDFVSVLLEALRQAPVERESCFSAVPANLSLLDGAPEIYVSAAGERVAELNFSVALQNYLALAGVELWRFLGSVALTLTSFVPELDALRLSIAGESVTGCELGGNHLSFEGGLMRRSDFASRIGSAAKLCFSNANGTLSQLECACSQAEARSPRSLLALMISMGGARDLSSVFPEGIHPNDLLGISVRERVASVNLSANFYSRCQVIDARAERNLIYGMVNTLCALSEIGAVRFLVEGRAVDSLSREIFFKTALLPNPLLIEPVPQPGAADAQSPTD